MSDIFISFVHEEDAVAIQVQRLLRKHLQGKNVFMSADQWQVYAGEVWFDRIRAELSSARVVLLLLSSRSVLRPWVNFEAGAAWLAGKVVIPVCFGGLTKAALPKPYSEFQALDLPSEAYYLVSSIAHHLSMLPPPPFFTENEETEQIAIAILRSRKEENE